MTKPLLAVGDAIGIPEEQDPSPPTVLSGVVAVPLYSQTAPDGVPELVHEPGIPPLKSSEKIVVWPDRKRGVKKQSAVTT